MDKAGNTTFINDPKPAFSMLMAVWAQITLVLGFSWSVMALLGAGHLLSQVPPAAVLASAAAGFALVQLLLRNRRPLLLLIGVDVAAAAAIVMGLCRIYGAESGAVKLVMSAAVLLGLLSQLKWTAGRFTDSALMVLIQVLLVSGLLQIWMADQLACRADWAVATFLMTAGLLVGITIFKLSGLRGIDAGKKSGLGILALPAAGAVAFCGLIAGAAAIFAEPAGKIISRGYNLAEAVLTALMNVIGNVIKFLFLRNRIRLDESAVSAVDGGGESLEYVPSVERDLDFFRILFHAVCILLLLILVAAVIRMLLQITIGKGIGLVRRHSSRIEQDGTFMERLKAAIRRMRQHIRARKILRRNPDSVAAMIVWLENRTNGSEELRRKTGETLRAFLLRLAAQTDGTDAAGKSASDALHHLADAADRACYSKDGVLLADFAESGILREYFAKS